MSNRLETESNRLEIELVPCDEATETVCPLCGECLRFSSLAGLLFDDGDAVGCICEKCLDESPTEVACRLHERVADLYDLIARAYNHLAGDPWSKLLLKVRQRARHWEKLACQISHLHSWPIYQGASVSGHTGPFIKNA